MMTSFAAELAKIAATAFPISHVKDVKSEVIHYASEAQLEPHEIGGKQGWGCRAQAERPEAGRKTEFGETSRPEFGRPGQQETQPSWKQARSASCGSKEARECASWGAAEAAERAIWGSEEAAERPIWGAEEVGRRASWGTEQERASRGAAGEETGRGEGAARERGVGSGAA